ncbi:MAG: formate/nitrite transporter family protein [Bacillus sp. (in: firmicutes)]|uniref:formate/nitrite transporter family protein n=1 Tax=Bacillus sp. SORGH_AS_0510 TaxID=3041771 RepID=UPI00278A9145|nr:formate/nitrite transporter family protein [Bacillus sp. SORGH_AS_0510]MDQ1146092.1 formate/nitrite transporter [Bacillus sp. SORGH_AS_0510]
MAFHSSQRIAELAVDAGAKKASMRAEHALLLGFLGGAFIALGFLLDIRVIANLPKEWGTFSSLLGGTVFPVGLMLIIIAGGELLTGNMMALPIAVLARRATLGQLARNWLLVLVSNFIGAIFVAFFFGHVLGLTETGPFLTKTVAIAQAKIDETFLQSVISAVGCNWLVCLGVWLAFGADDIGGKILAIWFPIMGFVAIGFQHVVANMFVIPAAIFAGHFTWADYFANFVPVVIGNAIGGGIFVALIYWMVHKDSLQPLSNAKPSVKKAG